MYKLFFKPSENNSAAADFIPYYSDDVFHLFYLFDHRNDAKYGNGVTWYKTETKDFVSFIDKGEMISRGTNSEPDPFVFTGSVLQAEGCYHIFYTGHNTTDKRFGYQAECIMHATSHDLDKWTKVPQDTFYAPDGYDKCDFRDPYVYKDEHNGTYYMLLCARLQEGNALRKGQTIRMKSTNLSTWTFDKIVYAPDAFHTHECPDLFQIGDTWYLIFSEYSDRSVTCYRTAPSPDGPWSKPSIDTFDGRAYYAAKTATDGKDRYLFGWVPTRWQNKDDGFWMWGGNLVVHKLSQNADKTLSVSSPQTIQAAFCNKIKIPDIRVDSLHKCTVSEIFENAPKTFRLTAKVKVDPQTDRFGLLLFRNASEDKAYELKFDLTTKTLSANTFPCFPQNQFGTYMLTRPIDKVTDIELIVDDDIAVLYANNTTALSVRFCNKFGNRLDMYVSDGKVEFTNIELMWL